jgi:uncharacterized integral membrane protein
VTSPESSPVRPRRRVSPRLIAAMFIVALVVLFIAQNRDTVKIQFFAATLTSPLWLLLVVMAGLGAATGFLLARRRR